MSESVRAALQPPLEARFGSPLAIERLSLVGGGASMEAWALDVQTPHGPMALLLRRSAGGRIYREALPLEHEHRMLEAASQAGVLVPRPYGYLSDVAGRPAFLMQRLEGETVGRRLVQKPEFAAAREALLEQMADQLARIHALDPASLDFLPRRNAPNPLSASLDALEQELDAVGEPHPAIELGLFHLRQRQPKPLAHVVCHGDFRVGNFMVNERGLVGVLDWEFAHFGDPREDLAWPLVRAWRFGMDRLRLGGIGQPDAFVHRYAELTGRAIAIEELDYFELLGNVRWAVGSLSQAHRHLSGEEHSVELAVLGRLASEVEHEILRLLEEGKP